MALVDKIKRAQGGAKLTVPVLSPKLVKIPEFEFRVLPYKYQDGNDPFIEVHTHNNIGKDGKSFALCPEKTFGDFCPYCETGRKLKEKLSEEEWKQVAKKFYTNANVYIPGLVRDKMKPEFTFLKVSEFQNFQKEIVGILTSKQLKALFKIPQETEFIPIWDLKTGMDLVIKKNEKSKQSMYETFTIKEGLEQKGTITSPAEKTIVTEYVKNTPNIIDDMVKAWGCQEKIMENFKAQYPKYAKDLDSDTTEDSNDSALPENDSPVSDDANEELNDILNQTDEAPFDTTANQESASNETATEDDYDDLMKQLQV